MDAEAPLLQPGATTLHHQLFLVLRDQVRRGVLAKGQALPTEHALGAQFGVSRITVRRALQELAAGGYVERRQGRGTFVRDAGFEPDAAPPLTLMDALRKADRETVVRVVEVARRRAPDAVAHALRLDAGAEALYALRVRSDTDRPLMVSEAWLPPTLADVVTVESLQRHALYELIRQAGITMGRVAQEVSAESADPLRAQLLDTAIGDPLIRVTRLIHDADGTPVQHLRLSLSPERSRVLMDIPADAIDTAHTGFIAHDVPISPGA